eukprot:scaffold1124_cov270-Chaetoceros_neogracile.AAC.31
MSKIGEEASWVDCDSACIQNAFRVHEVPRNSQILTSTASTKGSTYTIFISNALLLRNRKLRSHCEIEA